MGVADCLHTLSSWYWQCSVFLKAIHNHSKFQAVADSILIFKMPRLGYCGASAWVSLERYCQDICQQSYLLLFGIPSRTHSFFPGLKPSFSANPSHSTPSFLLLKHLLRGFPGLFTVISEHICFLLLVFFCFYTFYLSVPCGRLSWRMLAFERTLKSYTKLSPIVCVKL